MPLELVTPQKEAEKQVIDILSDLLEKAKAGEISEIACISFKRDGNYLVDMSSVTTVSQKIGALERIKFHLLTNTEDD